MINTTPSSEFDSPPTRTRSSSVNEVRRQVRRNISISDTFEFFTQPTSLRKSNDIDTVAKALLELEYFKRLKQEQDFLSVKECVTYMQYEYSIPGKVSAK